MSEEATPLRGLEKGRSLEVEEVDEAVVEAHVRAE
jgi:hypothetical protein